MMIRNLLCGRVRTLAPALLSVAIGLAPTSAAFASGYIGDLVYCDVDANGIYDGEDYPMDGIDVRVVCTAEGQICADETATTGTLHPTVVPSDFNSLCGEVSTFDPAGDISGRYLVEILNAGCNIEDVPFSCTVQVVEGTLPVTCSGLVTPREEGFPTDGNNDGDLCDAEDGPFPEGQLLGDHGTSACQQSPSPLPSNGIYMPELAGSIDRCAIYNDFGYTPPSDGGSGATRTPGFWKNHPVAVEAGLPIEFCGETITEVCDAVELLGLRGSGINKFSRHAVAAILNCGAFGCPPDIQETIDAGSAACAGGSSHPYKSAGTVLDLYNNSGEDIDDLLSAGPAEPKFCK